MFRYNILRFRALTTITITWKNHKNCSHTNKNSSRYFSCHTMVWGESYLCHILITRICGGSHSSVCYICLSLLKQAVFIIVPIILLNTVLHLKGQFALVDVLLQPKSSWQIWRHMSPVQFATCNICNMQH